jgi:4-aminobutyrate aminotransferase
METSVSLEQGDINQSALRQDYYKNLDEETRFLIKKDAAVFLHQALSTPVMNVLSKTEGPFIYDYQGKAYLDLHGNGVHNAGFSNPYVIEKVIQQLKQSLAFTPRRYTNEPAINLAKKLAEITPAGLDRVLFCPGGSEAIEMAVMLAKQITGKWKTLSFWDSYHGTGFQSAAIGGEEHFTVGQGPMVPGAFHVEFPNYYRNPWGLTNTYDIDAEYLRQIKIILQRNPDMAAVIGEPISATPVVPSLHYWTEVQSLCKRYNMFLIFDEIIEGFGRTGKMFASEHFVTPDVLVLGKTLGGGLLPFAGIITKEEYNILQHRSIGHFTHEKNPLCCTAGLATIEYIEEHQLAANSCALGEYLMEQLHGLQEIYPIIGHIAGKGLHMGIDLVKNRVSKERAVKEAEQIMYHCMKEGIAFKVIEGNVITMRPSLVIDKSHCDSIISVLRNALEKVKP